MFHVFANICFMFSHKENICVKLMFAHRGGCNTAVLICMANAHNKKSAEQQCVGCNCTYVYMCL